MKLFGIAGAMAVLASTLAQAGTITVYTDRAGFETAAGNVVVETFTQESHFPLPGVIDSTTNIESNISNPLTAGSLLPGAQYSTVVDNPSENQFNIDALCCFEGGFLDSILFSATERPLTVTFTTPVSAFGFDTAYAAGGPDISVLIRFLSGQEHTADFNLANVPGLLFHGFISDAPDIASVTIRSSGGYFGFAVDNFTFAADADPQIPEPGSIGMVAAGGALVLALRRFGWKLL